MESRYQEELIWKFLDDQCSPEERVLVNTALQSDSSFKDSFGEAKSIHDSLTNWPLDKAPDALIESTLSKIQPGFQYHFRPTPLFVFLGVVAVLCILGFLFPSSESGLTSLIPSGDSLNLPISIDWAVFTNIGSYFLALLAIPFFGLADQLIQKHPSFQKIALPH